MDMGAEVPMSISRINGQRIPLMEFPLFLKAFVSLIYARREQEGVNKVKKQDKYERIYVSRMRKSVVVHTIQCTTT